MAKETPELKAELIESKQDGNKAIGVIKLGHGSAAFNFMGTSQGSVFQRFQPKNEVRYNSNHSPIYDIQSIPTKFADQVKLARNYYHTEGITGTVIDVLTQFSISDYEHITDDEEVREFFDAIKNETSNLLDAIKWVFLEYYVACNAFPVRSDKGDLVEIRSGKKVPEYKWTVLNPEKVDITGSLLFDKVLITLEPNDELKSIVDSKDPAVKELIKSIPSDIRKIILKGGNIPMDADKVYHVSRNKQPFQKYAVPFIMRNVTSLRVKQKLMEMDLSTADGVINQLITVTIGNDNHPAGQKDLEALGEVINTPSKAYALLWNHTLNVQFHKPEANFFDADKYEQVNRDIAAGYGIAKPVISDGANYASQTVAVQSLIQWLEWGRQDIKKWLEREYRLIAKENGLKTYPKVRFKKVTLSEEKLIKTILMGLYEKGIISAETVLRETGHDIDVELKRLEKEKEYKDKGLLVPPISPYQQSGPGRPDETPEDESRDERDNTPAPTGGKLRAEANDIEEQMKEPYTREFADIFERFKDTLSNKLVRIDDRDLQDDIIDATIMAFFSEISALGTKYITSTFALNYKAILNKDYKLDVEAVEYLDNCISWNLTYVQKLSQDLRSAIKERLTNGTIPDVAVKESFNEEAYRVDMFGEEGVKKARFYSETVGMTSLGYNRGIWNATFEKTCEICAARHGHIFTVSELLELYPAHNHCVCFIDWLM